MHARWPLLILLSAPLLFLPYGFDTREVPRVALVLVLAAALLWTRRVSLSWWSLPWCAVCLAGFVWTPAPANETLLGALPYAHGTLLWLAYALIVSSRLTAPRPLAPAQVVGASVVVPASRGAAVGSPQPQGALPAASAFDLPVAVCALTLVQALLALGQLARGAPVAGSLGHPVFLGTWGALGAIVSTGLLRDRRYPALALLGLAAGLACIALSGRRSPLVMLLVAALGMIALLRPQLRRVLPVAAAVALPALVLALVPRADLGGVSASSRWLTRGGDAQATVLSRFDNFAHTWDAIASHPWAGLGPSAYADLAATWTPAGLTYYEARPHNLALLIAFSLGIPALLAFLLFAAGACLSAWTHARGGSGTAAAAAVLGPAYACHLLVNIDQPGIGIWICALWGSAVSARGSSLRASGFAIAVASRMRAVLASLGTGLGIGLSAAALALVVGTVSVLACQTSDLACQVAQASGSTGCLALRTRAELARRLDRSGSAQTRAEWMQRCQPGDHLARFQHALALHDAGQHAAAIDEMSQVMRALPGAEDVQMALADLFASDGQFARAASVLHPERARPEKRGQMWRLLGLLREEQGDLLGARDAYEQALRFMPNDAWLSQRVRAMP